MRRAQSWSVDYAMSILLFTIAVGLIGGLVSEHLQDRDYTLLIDDAKRLSHALVSDGYPIDWADDVVRAGILYDDRLSWRKLDLLSRMSEDELANALPTAANYAFVLRNNGSVVGIGETCSIGNTPFPQSTNESLQRHNLAYYARSDGDQELASWASSRNATIYEDDELLLLLTSAHQYGMILFEDPHFENELNNTFTDSILREQLRRTAAYGPMLFITGNPGTPVLGINISGNGTNGTILSHDEPYFSLNESDEINFTTAYTISYLASEDILLGNFGGATRTQSIANGAALWQYEDAQVYYFSSPTGLYEGSSLKPLLQEGLDRALIRSTVTCMVEPELLDTPSLVKIERLAAGHGTIYELTLYAWRNP